MRNSKLLILFALLAAFLAPPGAYAQLSLTGAGKGVLAAPPALAAFDPATKSASFTISGTGDVTATGNATEADGYAAAVVGNLSGVGSIKFQQFGTNFAAVGIYSGAASMANFIGIDNNGGSWLNNDGSVYYGGVPVAGYSVPPYGAGDVIEVNYDIPGLQVRARVNGGTWSNWLTLAGLPAGPYRLAVSAFNPGTGYTIVP